MTISIEGSGVTGDRICTDPLYCENSIEMSDIGDYTDVEDEYSLLSPMDFAPGLSIVSVGVDNDNKPLFPDDPDDFYITLSPFVPSNTAYSVSGSTSLVGASFSSFSPGVYSAQTEIIETGTGFLVILSNETPAQEPEPEFVLEWGEFGVAEGQLYLPHGVEVDPSGNVYVTERGNHRIQKFHNDGSYLTQWGSQGSGNGEFKSPHAVATDIMGNVYVGEVGNPWVQKFDRDGNFLVRWGDWDMFGGDLTGLDVSPAGLIYIGDFLRSQIHVFGTKAEQAIDPGIGGEVKTTDGQLSITIPDDALSEGETISAVQRLPEEPLVDVQIAESGGSGEVFAAYDLEPDGLVFDNPVTLTITADVTALNQNQRDALDIYLFSDTNADGIPDTFVALGAVCYVSDGPMFISTCTADILHFSMYALIAPIDTDQDGVADLFDGIEDQCSNTAIPESVPTRHLGFNRWALVDADTVFDTKLAKNDASANP